MGAFRAQGPCDHAFSCSGGGPRLQAKATHVQGSHSEYIRSLGKRISRSEERVYFCLHKVETLEKIW